MTAAPPRRIIFENVSKFYGEILGVNRVSLEIPAGITSLVGAVTGNMMLTLLAGGLSSYFLQLILLPIIMVGQNVISASQDARAEADHLTLTALHAMNVRQLEMLEQQRRILDQQQQILQRLPGKA